MEELCMTATRASERITSLKGSDLHIRSPQCRRWAIHRLEGFFQYFIGMDVREIKVAIAKARRLPAWQRDTVIQRLRFALALRNQLIHCYPAW